ncbi:DgyrCDS1546 [Dimorphilus gyrociliatus]|nr:DgyrCDS1546 [Dimorphilus gyrociliatus]
MMILGGINGPLNHYWYTNLDKFFPGRNLGPIVKKIIMDETIGSVMFTSIFFIGAGLLAGHTLNDAVDELKSKFITVYKADLTIWPVAQLINFYLIPIKFRVIFVAFLSFGWCSFLCYMSSVEVDKDEGEISKVSLKAIKEP